MTPPEYNARHEAEGNVALFLSTMHAEALAGADLPHAWDGDELLVPEVVESQTDAMFERLEGELGPFPVTLEPDAACVS